MEDWLGELIGIDPNSTTSDFGNNNTSNANLFSEITGGGVDSNLLGTIGGILSGKSGTMAQLASLGGLGALLNSVGGSSGGGFSGYKGGIPKYTAQRTMNPIPTTTTNAAGQTVPRRPGSGGVSYFSPMVYTPAAQSVPAGELAGIGGLPATNSAPAPQGAATPAQLVAKDDPFYQSPEYKAYQNDPSNMYATADMYDSPYFGRMSSGSVGSAMDRAYEQYKNKAGGGAPTPSISQQYARVAAPNTESQMFAAGGITNLGGYSDGGRLLKGPGDGVSDDIPAMIGDKQPARLADGEFVIPARIVSEIGNGSTDAGARKLYAMMDRVQKARGKTLKNVAANTKADKHLPA